MRTAIYTARDRRIANLIWRQGPLSRAELIELTGVHRNLVGTSADRLLKLGLIRETSARVSGPGRPSVPLEISPEGKVVIGLSISPGRVEASSFTLRGGRVGAIQSIDVDRPEKIIPAARSLLQKRRKEPAFAIGVSLPGLVDLQARSVLFSSALAESRDISLAPLFEAAGEVPLIIDNDQHALAARWLLTHRADPSEDILLIGFSDGRMGAAHLVDGRPSRGCVVSANELGHTRLLIDTPRCFCGHTGCLERICSSEFLHFRGVKRSITLESLLEDSRREQAVFDSMIDALGCGFANAVNFTRPNRLVLAGPLGRKPAFLDALTRAIRARTLPALVDRVQIQWWDEPLGTSSEAAAWLALASAFYDGWTDAVEYETRRRADVESE